MTNMHLDMNYWQYYMKFIGPKYLSYRVLISFFCGLLHDTNCNA